MAKKFLKLLFFHRNSGTRVLVWITRVLGIGDFLGNFGSGSTREASLIRMYFMFDGKKSLATWPWLQFLSRQFYLMWKNATSGLFNLHLDLGSFVISCYVHLISSQRQIIVSFLFSYDLLWILFNLKNLLKKSVHMSSCIMYHNIRFL